MYVPKTEQFKHQREHLDQHWDSPGRGVFWEPGTGKSKDAIDTGGKLYSEHAIEGMFILAPNGLHRNFITKELPKHLPDDIAERCAKLYWRSDKAKTKWHTEEARALLEHKDGFRVLAMSYDGIMTEPGRKLAKEFLTTTRCLYVADETQRIKEPGAARTKRVLASGAYAPFRRVLTGTPIANAPWDTYTQIKFADPTFWAKHGLDSMEAMKSQFGVWETGVRRVSIAQAKWPSGALKRGYTIIGEGQAMLEYPKLVLSESGRPQYKNLDQLRQLLEGIRSRVRKRDVLDLPPKLYTTLEFDMSPAQERAAKALRELGFYLTESGRACTTDMALKLMLRLQQISCGYIVTDLEHGEDDPVVEPILPNPRMDLLLEITQDLSHPCLIWSRFTKDIDLICEHLRNQGKTVGRYDGAISDDECGHNEDAFHRGEIQFLVLNQAKGSEGLTLIEAQTAIFYSNTFKLIERLQAEDRPDRIGQTHSVNNIDLVGRNTVDEQIVENLCGKFDVATIVNGDSLRKWLKSGQLI